MEDEKILSETEETEDEAIIDIITSEGACVKAHIITTFTEKTRNYIALMPVDSKEDSVLLYRYKETVTDGEEGIELLEIISDMEFDTAAARFEDIMEARYE